MDIRLDNSPNVFLSSVAGLGRGLPWILKLITARPCTCSNRRNVDIWIILLSLFIHKVLPVITIQINVQIPNILFLGQALNIQTICIFHSGQSQQQLRTQHTQIVLLKSHNTLTKAQQERQQVNLMECTSRHFLSEYR